MSIKRWRPCLRKHDLDLPSCPQAELDAWLTTRPRALRLLPAPDRVAGLLVLLYGQTVSRISRIRRADLDIATDPSCAVVHLRFGTDAIEIGEPFSTLLQSLPESVSTGTARALASDDP